jgi:arsenite-transporting ATPase
VGKTSLAAATGIRLARMGVPTLVMSVDPAHSLADAFNLEGELFHGKTSDPVRLMPNLDIHEVNIQQEIKRHWKEISSYVSSVFRATGINEVEAEELAILPGMEELSAMMYVNQYRREERYQAIILDCAPTAESLRFVAMPTTLDWYMKHIFPFHRSVLKAVRPLANRISPVELPADSYFANVQELFLKIEGIDELLQDPKVTSVRLVTNAERMVLRETQRAYVYFSLYGLTVDRIVANRVLPVEVGDPFFVEWRRSQEQILAEMDQYFAPVPVRRVPLLTREVLGLERLDELADAMYPGNEDPAQITQAERPYVFDKVGQNYEVRLRLPFAEKGEVGLFKKGDELVVQVGTLRRHIGLPSSLAALEPSRARLDGGILRVEMKEAHT